VTSTAPPDKGVVLGVSRYCVLNVAVYTALEVGIVIVCVCAPPSLQVWNEYRVPLLPCPSGTPIECVLPATHRKVCGLVTVAPSTTICKPGGFVVTVVLVPVAGAPESTTTSTESARPYEN